MRTAGHGETQPRLDDDRLPVVLVTLDGLGDRPAPVLGDRTPCEAAATPTLDALTARGAAGWHLPFGWGRAPASELAHWAMFGYADVRFPGRAVLEAAGAGVPVEEGVAVVHAALRTSQVVSGRVWITGRAGDGDDDDAEALLAELAPLVTRHTAELRPLGGRGEALLVLAEHPDGAVTDSDPFFEDFHPWLRVRGCTPEAGALAEAATDLLLAVRAQLLDSPVNAGRRRRGLPALDVLTTKWGGSRGPLPPFVEQVGVAGAAVTSSRLYRGLARLLGLAWTDLAPVADLSADLRARVDAARALLDDGARFVHVHTKAPDEAGHRKDPQGKATVLAHIDAGLAGLAGLADHAVVAVTGDHATPSTAGVLHTGEPSPFVVAGPTVRADGVRSFGEQTTRAGDYGVVRASELLPLLFGHANRPVFLGHRATPQPTAALPDEPEPMPPAPGG